jgi:RNA polymerase sigma factor (sigma-70 family)
VDYLRKRRTDIVSLDAAVSDGKELTLAGIIRDARSDTVQKLNETEIRQRLFECIESLSAVQKAIFIETEFNGRSFKELSRDWDVPLGTLLARKSRALKRIRIALTDLGRIDREERE